MRNAIKLGGMAILPMLVAAGVASAQPVIQPNFQPGAGSSQPFVHEPGPTPQTNQTARPFSSAPQGAMQGPVTGYGAGGMARAPGVPPNPPYTRSGR
jgi:hypothetical protein